jgi:hypothetical protein
VHRRLSLAAALSLAIASGGCAQEEELEGLQEAIGTLPLPIQGGYVDDQSSAVVGIVHFNLGNFGACSGTLIAPNVVLTAGHCVAQSTEEGVNCETTRFGAQYSASSLYVTTKTTFGQNPSEYHQGKEIVLPPGGDEFCGRDQAILILAQPITEAEAVPRVPRVDWPLQVGEEYYAVGFGGTFDGDQNNSSRHRRDGLFTQCVGQSCPSLSIKLTEWRGEAGVCSGDSGGPAFDLQDRVVGVASRGAPGCNLPVYGHVHGWADWIKDTTMYATTSAGIEPPAWATGYPTDPAYSHPVGGECKRPAPAATAAVARASARLT